MAEMSGEIVLQKQIRHYAAMRPKKMIFCARKDDMRDFSAHHVIRQSAPGSVCVEIERQTAGSACTALLAAERIDNGQELVLLAIDELIEANPAQIIAAFRGQKSDAGVVSFRSVHPRYSFARLDSNGGVCEVAEKKPVSANALASFYYFKRGHDFVECAKNVIRKDRKINGAFFISQAVNEMILRQKTVALHRIKNEEFHPLKTEMQLAQYMLEAKERREGRPT
jgi:dTDP-glucose pyrophosphorylase